MARDDAINSRYSEWLETMLHGLGHEVFTTVSIGIAPSAADYDSPDEILRDADTAMYRAKSLGKSRDVVFDRALHNYSEGAA